MLMRNLKPVAGLIFQLTVESEIGDYFLDNVRMDCSEGAKRFVCVRSHTIEWECPL